MMKAFILIPFICLMSFIQSDSFKQSQLRFDRVSDAEKRLGPQIEQLLSINAIHDAPFELYLRAFKEEGELEVWFRKKSDTEFRLLKNYAICSKSGSLGPKRKQGDKQVPEGFYHLDRFNPMSSYHLSLGVNYPNPSDLERSDARKPGGDIFIHGRCVTIGCLPMTDEYIEEIYLLCVESKDRGAGNIPVTLFPRRMDPKNYSILTNDSTQPKEVLELWSSLKTAYDYFNTEKRLPTVKFKSDGSHHVGG